MRHRQLLGGGGLALVVLAAGLSLAAQSAPAPEWRYWGGDRAFTRYLPLDQITAQNVAQLKVAWRQPGVDPALKEAYPDLRVSGNFRSTPLMIHGVLYAPNGVGLIRALDPATGATRWEQKPFGTTIEEISRPSPRGAEDLGQRRRGAAVPRARGVPLLAQCQDRRVRRGVRRSRPDHAALGSRAGRALQLDCRPHRGQRRDRRRRRHRRRRRRRRQEGGHAREHPRLRRPHREAPVDVPRRAAARRGRGRDVGRGIARLLGRFWRRGAA